MTPLLVSDVSDIYVGWLNDREINQFLESRHSPQTRQSCEAFVAGCEKDPLSHLFKIVRKDTGQHIGNIKLGPVNVIHGAGALSLLIGDKASHGNGFATEAILALTEWGFDSLGLHRVEAGCYDANLGSLRAFLKAGYVVEGFFRQARVDTEGHRVGMFWMAKLNAV
ncbi:MAG: GNAT family N-acetyltransferase [Paracoccaceae bacterium]